MKNTATLISSAFILCFFVNTGHAHIYNLSNLTDNNYQVRAKLSGLSEPYYIWGNNPFDTKENYNNILPAKTTYTLIFDLFNGPFDYARKFGLCLSASSLEYRVVTSDPAAEEAWQPLKIHFVTPDHHDAIIEATIALAAGLRGLAAAIISVIPVIGRDGQRAIDAIDIGAIVRNIALLKDHSMCRSRGFYLTLDEQALEPVLMSRAN